MTRPSTQLQHLAHHCPLHAPCTITHHGCTAVRPFSPSQATPHILFPGYLQLITHPCYPCCLCSMHSRWVPPPFLFGSGSEVVGFQLDIPQLASTPSTPTRHLTHLSPNAQPPPSFTGPPSRPLAHPSPLGTSDTHQATPRPPGPNNALSSHGATHNGVVAPLQLPLMTHRDLYLCISPELYLQELVISRLDQV